MMNARQLEIIRSVHTVLHGRFDWAPSLHRMGILRWQRPLNTPRLRGDCDTWVIEMYEWARAAEIEPTDLLVGACRVEAASNEPLDHMTLLLLGEDVMWVSDCGEETLRRLPNLHYRDWHTSPGGAPTVSWERLPAAML